MIIFPKKARLCFSENQIALNADWDLEKLSEQLKFIMDDGLDLEITGFDDDFLKETLNLDANNELLDPLEGEKEEKAQTNKFLSFGSYKMELNRKLCATRRELSQHAGWTIALDADRSYCIVLL